MEEEEVRPPQARALFQPLEGLSEADLTAYRMDLEREIARVDAELARRRSVRSAAEALFRSRPAEGG